VAGEKKGKRKMKTNQERTGRRRRYDLVGFAEESGDDDILVAREGEREEALRRMERVEPCRHVLGSCQKVFGVGRPINVRHIAVMS